MFKSHTLGKHHFLEFAVSAGMTVSTSFHRCPYGEANNLVVFRLAVLGLSCLRHCDFIAGAINHGLGVLPHSLQHALRSVVHLNPPKKSLSNPIGPLLSSHLQDDLKKTVESYPSFKPLKKFII